MAFSELQHILIEECYKKMQNYIKNELHSVTDHIYISRCTFEILLFTNGSRNTHLKNTKIKRPASIQISSLYIHSVLGSSAAELTEMCFTFHRKFPILFFFF